MAIRKFFKEEGWAELRSQLTHFGLAFMTPYVVSAITFVAGYTQGGIPFAYLIAATSIVFMSMAVGMNYWIELFAQSNPEGKIVISGPIVGKRYTGAGTNQARLVAVKYGLLPKNNARFPIELTFNPLHVSVAGSINPSPNRPITGVTCPPGAAAMFWEAEVPISTSQMKGQLVEGVLETDIEYGKPGKQKYKMTKKYKIYLQFNNKGDLIGYDPSEA